MEREKISSERLSELRQLIRAEVSSEHVQGRIRECVSDAEREDGGVREESLLRLLEEKGLVDQVMAVLKLEKETPLQRKYPTMTNGESSSLHDKLKDGMLKCIVSFLYSCISLIPIHKCQSHSHTHVSVSFPCSCISLIPIPLMSCHMIVI